MTKNVFNLKIKCYSEDQNLAHKSNGCALASPGLARGKAFGHEKKSLVY
jgi:hypothetical protein